MREFEWTALLERLQAGGDGVLLGIGDDAAMLESSGGEALVVSTDTLNAGVHFLPTDDPESLGHKSLAVSLSDLAAMGATPAWALFNVSLPSADGEWMSAIRRGFSGLLEAHRTTLVGGDTTQGPLSLSWTLIGRVDPDQALRRDGAVVGDRVWVSGQPGMAAEGLSRKLRNEPLTLELDRALHWPEPRLALGQALRGVATACIDVSDGLVADLGHLCRRSGVGAQLLDGRLPTDEALDQLDGSSRRQRQWAGGDDYELCFTAPDSATRFLERLSSQLSLPLTEIGEVRQGDSVEVVDADGRALMADLSGHEHLRGEADAA